MKKTIIDFIEMKEYGENIAWLTAYDYPSAYALEQAGIDLILVGDSGIMCQYGEDSTIPSTMEDQIRMTRAVRRGAPDTFIVGDMPFGSYEVNNEEGVRNAIRLVKEGDCDAVKFEGFRPGLARAMTEAGIVVFGHLGLTPQSVGQVGGYRVQRNLDVIYKEMMEMYHSGAGFMLIEAVPSNFDYDNHKPYNRKLDYKEARNQIVFGIGAGKNVDGQLLIYHDIVGYYPDFKPRFAKNYWSAALELTPENSGMLKTVQIAAQMYIKEVKSGEFPSEKYMYKPKEVK